MRLDGAKNCGHVTETGQLERSLWFEFERRIDCSSLRWRVAENTFDRRPSLAVQHDWSGAPCAMN